jgi:hypothetical protein
MHKILLEKDSKIEQQRAEITNLRKKNFDFRQKMVLLEEKAHSGNGNEMEAMASLQMAMQLHKQEVKQREREMMMQVMMNSMIGANGALAEEERLLQRAIEESKQDADPNCPNTDNMTYE